MSTDQFDEITVTSVSTSAQTSDNAEQYGRKVSLLVGQNSGDAIDLSQMRIRFQVERGDFQNPNTADIRVYNLSRATASKVAGSEFTQLSLQAGYEGNFGLIFKGVIVQARKGRESQLDSYVDFTAADGDEAYHFAPIACSLSSAGPKDTLTTFVTAMKAASTSQMLTLSANPVFGTNAPPRGRVFYGNVRDEMRTFAKANDMTWSVQDGQLTLIPKSAYIPGDIVVVSPSTGLIGVPEQTQNGVELRVLLNPNIKIGQAIRIDSTINQFRYGIDQLGSQAQNTNLQLSATKLNGDGLYYVMCANHSGDTRGNPWYTDITCLAIDASVPIDDATIKNFQAYSGPVFRN